MSTPSPEDIRALRRDKYNDDPTADLSADIARLTAGEPLAYVIGWIPFLGLRIQLDSHPLIPRPETEWWAEKLIGHLEEKFGNDPFELLDLCAGSGAIGLTVLKHFKNARVSFSELMPEHVELIRKNIEANGLDGSRVVLRRSDLFSAFAEKPFDVIATNPPYVPNSRVLPESVTNFEPEEALFGGADGLDIVRRITKEAGNHLSPSGELWMECDSGHADAAKQLLQDSNFPTVTLHTDQYDRPRLLVSCTS